MLKILKYIFLLIFVTGCGYSPIYSNLSNNNIGIQIEKVNGDKNINKLIVQKLSRYENENTEKIYNVKVESSFEKLILTKNTAGNATNFRLNLNVKFITTKNGNSKEFQLFEKFDMKKGDTIFEEEKYENSIKNNMTSIIVQRFISQLLIE
tara:strand:+ start:3331 stop:3783 length:453 start_codon:yes stop_codon:yes gene_type:complete